MRRGEVLHRTERNDSRRIDIVVRDVIVPFDVVEVHRLGNAIGLVEIFEIAEEIAVVDNPPEVALKVTMIDGIEPDQRHEEPQVGLGEV